MILPKERDPRFVTIRRGGTLTDADHRRLALWAAACAEHVLHHFEAVRPEDPRPRLAIEQARAWVRGFAMINVADSHPLIVPRIRNYLTGTLKLDEPTKLAWIQHWLGLGLEAMETLLGRHAESGKFCHGDQPTVADIGLVTQVTPARTFNTPLTAYPRVMRIHDACMAIPAFAAAHPSKQADAE